MGLFKQMKQMKQVVAEAPDLIANAQAMQQAHGAQAAHAQAGAQAPAAGGAELDTMTAGGVALRPYANICRAANDRGITDQEGIAGVAAEHGVDRATWDAACLAWMDEMKTKPAVAQRFNSIWRGVA